MVRLKLFLCAQGVVVDQQTNNASVFSILDEYTPFGLPNVIPSFVVLAMFKRDEDDPEKQEFRLSLSLNDETIFEQKLEVDFGGAPMARQMVNLQGVIINQPGTLTACIELDDDTRGEWSINVNPPKKPTVKVQTGTEE